MNIIKLVESEMDKAEVTLAARNIDVNLQQIAEKLSKLTTTDLLSLQTKMREHFGKEKANDFEENVSDALESALDAIKEAKKVVVEYISYFEDIVDGKNPEAPTNDLGNMENWEEDEESNQEDLDFMNDEKIEKKPKLNKKDNDEEELDLDIEMDNPDRAKRENYENKVRALNEIENIKKAYNFMVREGFSLNESVKIISENYNLKKSTVLKILKK